jgi:hypothetical protein
MRHIPKPTPATALAFTALFVALGGPGQAAQLATNLTSTSHHTLRGPRGPRGPRGFRGPAGPRGHIATPITRDALVNTPGAGGGPAGGTASCHPGEIATGGGGSDGGPVVDSYPASATAWHADFQFPANAITQGIVYVVCEPTS